MTLKFIESSIKGCNSLAFEAIAVQQAAIAPDRAVTHFERCSETGECVFEGQLLVKPPRQLSAVAHHLGVVKLPVCKGVDRLCNKRMKLYNPFRAGVFGQPVSGDR